MSAPPEWTERLQPDDRSPNGGDDTLDMPGCDFVARAARGDWRDAKALHAAPTLVPYLRQKRFPRTGDAQVGDLGLPRGALRRTLRYIHANLDSKLTWDELASAVGMDAFAFGRGFKMSTGITPHQYVIRCRLRRAVKLLQHTEMGITDIALEVGCSCQSHLTTLFARHIGTTPGAFRKSAKGDQRGQRSELTRSGLLHELVHRQPGFFMTTRDAGDCA